jgi:hypothetical protein
MILQQVLYELESSRGPVNLNDLSRKLGVEPSALAGMIAFLLHKGRLTRGCGSGTTANIDQCSDGNCSALCLAKPVRPELIKLPVIE